MQRFRIVTTAKIYPKFTKIYEFKIPLNAPEFSGIKKTYIETENTNKSSSPDDLERSIRRTKVTIADLMICNEFDLFCTWTIKNYRNDHDRSIRRILKWLKNQKDTYGTFQHLLVPEFHKDGKALHFHGLLKGYTGPLSDSGKKMNNRTVYNFSANHLGWNTAIKIDNYDHDSEKVAAYIQKYITKQTATILNKKRYWCSKNLIRPLKITQIKNPDQIFHNAVKVFEKNTLTIYRSPFTIETTINQGDTNNANPRPRSNGRRSFTDSETDRTTVTA